STVVFNGGASDQTFDCTSVGTQTITLTVTDANGNVSTCDAQVTIEDNVAPTAICQDITVQLDANGEVVITAADIDNGSFDNCGAVTLTVNGGASEQTFDCTRSEEDTSALQSRENLVCGRLLENKTHEHTMIAAVNS